MAKEKAKWLPLPNHTGLWWIAEWNPVWKNWHMRTAYYDERTLSELPFEHDNKFMRFQPVNMPEAPPIPK